MFLKLFTIKIEFPILKFYTLEDLKWDYNIFINHIKTLL